MGVTTQYLACIKLKHYEQAIAGISQLVHVDDRDFFLDKLHEDEPKDRYGCCRVSIPLDQELAADCAEFDRHASTSRRLEYFKDGEKSLIAVYFDFQVCLGKEFCFVEFISVKSYTPIVSNSKALQEWFASICDAAGALFSFECFDTSAIHLLGKHDMWLEESDDYNKDLCYELDTDEFAAAVLAKIDI